MSGKPKLVTEPWATTKTRGARARMKELEEKSFTVFWLSWFTFMMIFLFIIKVSIDVEIQKNKADILPPPPGGGSLFRN
jgi:hypothetical protein